MHSVYSRINNVSATLSTCVMVLLAAIACSSLLFYADPKGTIDVTGINVYNMGTRRRPLRKQDQVRMSFNTTTDLRPLFNWNTKQLFVWVQAEYTNSQGTQNEVVLWDRIVRRKEDALIDLAGKNRYFFHELSKKFAGSGPAHYSLKYNIMPYVGLLTSGEAARTTEPIAFPAVKEATD
ncbi:signal peptidase subunit [Amylostereum chailletii]|nr:signal peptidase subunit [Amylostereum chailletii]